MRRSLRLNPDTYAAIQEVAEAESRSVNAQIEVAIREHVAAWRRRRQEKEGAAFFDALHAPNATGAG